ncbi:hypothetical protein R5W24_004211 [Gemmata sp. JC717]|uniref:hypothetical protein n=1 Tax=Gemmata algarum TaxID=2975278 RepID=UPI0021BA5DD9|nr:hypothetical protein [Gemmata algarum]MDY3555076.1 hypothetical protein [Gemmata algarum]
MAGAVRQAATVGIGCASLGSGTLPAAEEPTPRILTFPTGEVKCPGRLGGYLEHHHRTAA